MLCRASLVYDLLVQESSAELRARIKRKFWSRDLPTTTDDDVDTEITAYVGDSAAPGAGDDPLRFWQARGSRCPLLAPVVRLVLAIPATSVPSERLFSTAGLVEDRLRARHGAEDFVPKQISWGTKSSAPCLVSIASCLRLRRGPTTRTATEYWLSRKGQCPHLSTVALDLVSAPASQADTERIFSVFGDLTAGKRNQILTSL